MAGRNNAAKTTPAPAAETTRAERVRQYVAANPGVDAGAVAKHFAEQDGKPLTKFQVERVLSTRKGGGRKPKLTPVEQVRLARDAAKEAGSVDAARKAISKVGAFIEAAGGVASALAALDLFAEVSA